MDGATVLKILKEEDLSDSEKENSESENKEIKNLKEENLSDSERENSESENKENLNEKIRESEENKNLSDKNKKQKSKMENLNKPIPFSLEGNVEENWRKFKRQYTNFMLASGKTEESKKVQAAILQNLVGPEAIELLDTFNLTDENLEDPEKILEAFEKNCKKEINETFERFVFANRIRKDDETIESYVKELKKLVKTCGYDSLEDSMIRDNIIRTMKDTRLQQSILKINKLTLEDLIKNIKTNEASKEQSRKIQEQTKTASSVDAITRRGKTTKYENRSERAQYPARERKRSETRRTSKPTEGGYGYKEFNCGRCNGRHLPRQCPAYDKKCYRCNKVGHYAVACNTNSRRVDNIESASDLSEEDDTSSEENFVINTLTVNSMDKENNLKKKNTWIERIIVGDKKINLKLTLELMSMYYQRKYTTKSNIIVK